MNHDEAVGAARELVDLVIAEAAEAEELRRVTEPVMGAMADADLFRLVVPQELGGHGLGARSLVEVTRTLGRGCPSTAWTLSFLQLHAWIISKLPEAGRAEVFADGPTPFVPMPLAPTGRATPVDGGFSVDGRWEWATGSAHAGWYMVHAIVDGPGFETRFLALPASEVRVEDVWHTSGMRATSSNAVVVDGVFVPEARSLAAVDLDAPSGLGGDGMAALPMRPILALVASAPALGAAEAAAELFRRRLEERVLAFTLGDRAVEQPTAQMRLGAVSDEVRTAAARWEGALAGLEDAAEIGPEQRVDVRLAAASTVRRSRRAIRMVCEGSGASTFFESNRLQRLQRDVEVLGGHVIFDWDRTAELAGRVALGFEVRPTDLV